MVIKFENVSSIVYCWRITKKNGNIIRLTTHSRNIEIDNEVFFSGVCYSSSSITNEVSRECTKFSMQLLVYNDLFSFNDLQDGSFLFATVNVLISDYNNTEYNHLIKTGYISNINLGYDYCIFECSDIIGLLSQNINKKFSRKCRAVFGGPECALDIKKYTLSGKVMALIDRNKFSDDQREEADNYFTGGILSFFQKNSEPFVISQYLEKSFTLFQEIPLGIEVGDRYQVVCGCDKEFSTCASQFHNSENFRGEPSLT